MKLFSSLRSLLIVGLAALLVAGCASSAKRESTGEYLDDTVITTRVKTALLQDKDVSGLRINVETFKGVVQLSGFANTDAERRKAVSLARDVAGVRSVRNDIVLK